MKTQRLYAVLLVLLLALSLVGCREEVEARFVRYQIMQDGTKVGMIEFPSENHETLQSAWTNVDDLEIGDRVWVEFTGRSWDQPQWAPEVQITRRIEE